MKSGLVSMTEPYSHGLTGNYPLISERSHLISNTTTRAGLVVKSAIDNRNYETGIKVTDAELARVICIPDHFHGEWNYAIRPRSD